MTEGAESIDASELASAVGYVVLEASVAEDSLGELIVLRTGIDAPDPRWSRSGETLVRALEDIGDPTLRPIADEARALLPLRHHVVHGLWLRPPSGRSVYVTMLRGKSTKKRPENGGYDIRGWSAGRLMDLARRFRALDRLANDAISDAMGLKRTDGSFLPPCTEPVVPPTRKNSGGSGDESARQPS